MLKCSYYSKHAYIKCFMVDKFDKNVFRLNYACVVLIGENSDKYIHK